MFILTNILNDKDFEKTNTILNNLDCVANGGQRLPSESWYYNSNIGVYKIGDRRYPGVVPPGTKAKNVIWFMSDINQYKADADFILSVHSSQILHIRDDEEDTQTIILN